MGFFVAPGIVKSVAERSILEETGRRATIDEVRLNPYKLSATVAGFKLYEPDNATVAAEIGSIDADISSASIWKRALVFDQLRVVDPHLRFARLTPDRFSFSDVVDRLAAKPKSDTPFLFSLNNIQVDGGSIDIDDRVTGRKHRIDGIRVGLPFISNLPYDTDIFVTPDFAAQVNGSAVAVTGRAQPFSTTRQSAIELDVAGLDVPAYIDLVPAAFRFRVASGRLDATVVVTFHAAATTADGKATPQALTVGGRVALSDLRLTHPDGKNAVTAKTIDVDLEKVDVFAGDVAVRSVTIDGAHVDAVRRGDGSIDLVELFRPAPSSTPKPTQPADATAGNVGVTTFKLTGASVTFTDETLAPRAVTQLKNIDVDASALALSGKAETPFAVSLVADDGATLALKGSATLAARSANGTFALKRFKPSRVTPYLGSLLAARIDDGDIDLAARFRVDASGPSPTGVVDQVELRVDRLRTSLPDEKAALLGAEAIVLNGGRFDLASRAFTADALTMTAPVVTIKRDAKGRFNLQAVLVESPASPAAPVAVAVVPESAPAFSAAVKQVTIERGDIGFEDRMPGTAVRVRAAPFDLRAGNIGTAAGAVVPFDLSTVVDKRGKLAVKGTVALDPLRVDAAIDATQVAVGWLAAYAGDRLNITVDNADLNARGQLKVEQPAKGAMRLAYRGSGGIGRMRALDKVTGNEFVRWKTLDVPQVDLQMPGKNAPFAVTLGTVAIDDFYARLIVNANGRLNVQDVLAEPGRQQSVTEANAAPAPTPAAPATAATSAPMPQVRVGAVKLTTGRIGFTDNFIKPNYSANLTNLVGDVAAVASDDPKPSAIQLVGRIDGGGSLEVKGTVNPFAATRFTDIDIAAEAKDIELTRLSPYAIKYAGYSIERGKLSMTVKYRIENGRLEAQNRLFLDQLTFGERVESPTATTLPVQLAVSLLKNSRGEIDINLPITGSLSDPQFSIGGVIARVLVNLITRAVTSPFSLIAAAVGGGSNAAQELGYVEFAPGVSELGPASKARLETLAKALGDRPALKLDIIGRFDPAVDPDGIKRDHLLDRLKDLKAKDQSKPGDPVGRGDVTIEPGEYARYLTRVYDDSKLPDKPRNLIGFAKSLPVEEMERLLLAGMKLDPDDPRWLAEARADVVRHYIEDTAKVSPSRVFLVTPRLNATGITDGGKATRVDFALR